MNKTFPVVLLCLTLSGCSFFSRSTNTSVDEPITTTSIKGTLIHKIPGSSNAKVTPLENGGKKYVITNRFEATKPEPCPKSPFDDFPIACAGEFGLPGFEEIKTYLVDSKEIIYQYDYKSEEIPVPTDSEY